MGKLVACKNEEDPIKNEGARVVTTLFINFSDAQWQLTPKSAVESCRNSNSSKLFIVALIVYKNEEDSFKIESTRVSQHFSHYKSNGIFPNAQGQVTHK